MAERWEARAGRGARWGGRWEGVREGWVWAREVRRGGEVRRGVSWEVLCGGVSHAVGGGREGREVRFVEEDFGEPVLGGIRGLGVDLLGGLMGEGLGLGS